MPVDVFGRTTAARDSTQVISRGVTLTQANDAFLRQDGENAATSDINMDSHKLNNIADPINEKDAANKEYVDSNAAGTNKVSKSRDTVSGNLLFTALEENRLVGCTYLPIGKKLSLIMGNMEKRLNFQNDIQQNPLTLETTRGLMVRAGDKNVCKIGPTIAIYKIKGQKL